MHTLIKPAFDGWGFLLPASVVVLPVVDSPLGGVVMARLLLCVHSYIAMTLTLDGMSIFTEHISWIKSVDSSKVILCINQLEAE